MASPSVRAALKRARDDALAGQPLAAPDRRSRSHHLAIGDPQAPLPVFFEILEGHGALTTDGRLATDVALVTMGDHFDWGGLDDRVVAAEDGLCMLAWLAAHPPDQVTLLLGNHDLARVGELYAFDDRRFARAQAEADAAYHNHRPARTEEAFRKAFGLPSWEIVARDFATFRASQRALVERLLRAKRLRAALATAPDLLLCHAGVTSDDLQAIGVSPSWQVDAFAVAAALNELLDAAVAAWEAGPLSIPPLHRPGDDAGEGQGIFYHRPCRIDDTAGGWNDLRRRFDPKKLPVGLIQAIGHIRDNKCRLLLGEDESQHRDGPLRHLRVRASEITYARGLPAARDPAAATLLFLDGGMGVAEPGDYEMLDLDTLEPARRS
jgi:hypothetical protein